MVNAVQNIWPHAEARPDRIALRDEHPTWTMTSFGRRYAALPGSSLLPSAPSRSRSTPVRAARDRLLPQRRRLGTGRRLSGHT